MAPLAWFRRLVVSVTIGSISYICMLGTMIASLMYADEMAPVIKLATNLGRSTTHILDALLGGSYWGQIAVNFMRERVNMTHVILSIPAILVASVLFGVPLNSILGGTRTAFQRVVMAFLNVPTSVILAVALFSFNALQPAQYAVFLRFVDTIWHESLDLIEGQKWIPGSQILVNAARTGLSGHHFVTMALCSMVAAFLISMIFAAFARKRSEHLFPI